MGGLQTKRLEALKRVSLRVEHIDILKTITNVGDRIYFDKKHIRDGETIVDQHISGIVTDKYSHTFIVDGKHTYTWKDYLLGCSIDIRKHVFELEEFQCRYGGLIC